MLDVNKIHYILATCNNSEQLVIELEQLSLDNGISESDLIQYRNDAFFASRFDSSEVAYFKRMLKYLLEETLVQSILEELFQKYVKRDMVNVADDLYMTENEIKKLEKLLTKFHGNTSSVKMKKYAIEKKIATYKDIVNEMHLILAI